MNENYLSNFESTTRDVKFTSIPPDFEVVVKRMIPEIVGMGVIDVVSSKIISPFNFETIERFFVSVRLISESPAMLNNRQYYSDKLNSLFNYYSGYNFIKFYVEEIHCLPQEVKTNYDKFVELFKGN
jgi:hypothetical protein